MINVTVLILPERRVGSGDVYLDIPFSGIREDIAEAFNLGDPEDWTIALVPKNLAVAPEDYRLGAGDTVLIMPSTTARRKGFVGGPEVAA